MVQFLKPCIKEIQEFPEETREDLADALARLQEGHPVQCHRLAMGFMN